MPDLTGFPALDVLIGMAFLFFLLSTICSAINEGIAAKLGWRAKNLEDAVARLLGAGGDKPAEEAKTNQEKKALDDAKALHTKVDQSSNSDLLGHHLTERLFEHWRIKALVKDPDSPKTRNNRPSYMPAHAFSRALAEVVAALPVPGTDTPATGTIPDPEAGKTLWQTEEEKLMASIQSVVAKLPQGQLRSFLAKAVTAADNDLAHFRLEVEGAFNDTMSRASGWYKRHVQLVLTLIAIGVTLCLNVDSLRVADRLWKNPELRAAVVTQATKGEPKGAQTVASTVNRVKQLQVPIGWGRGNAPTTGKSKKTIKKVGHFAWGVVRRIPGWLATIIALSLGAPFWFDILSRLARLRNSGVPEEPRTLSDRGTAKRRRKPLRQGAGAAGAAEEDPAQPVTRL